MPEDVMSPQCWEEMEKRLPPKMRKKFAPMIRQVKEYAEHERQRPDIEAAHDTLEKYRRKYERLTRNPRKLLQRAEKLFAEPPFVSMRFTADEIQQAFEKVGYPPISRTDDAFFKSARKGIDFLVDRKKRDMLARRLVRMLPDYVAAGRHLDAWILQHNAVLLDEPPEDACGPFLLCMFMHGIREWDDQRDREQVDMFRHLGIDPEDIRRKGFEGVASLLQEMITSKDKTAEMQKFLDAHPELKALTEAQCRESEDAAVRLVQREDAHSLLLAPDEIVPWLPVFEERMTKVPGMRRAMQKDTMPDEKTQKALADVMYSISREMAGEVFTKPRLDRLMDDIHAYRRDLSRKDREAMTGVNGALMMAQSPTPAAENHFLTMLCYTSFMSFVDSMHSWAGKVC